LGYTLYFILVSRWNFSASSAPLREICFVSRRGAGVQGSQRALVEFFSASSASQLSLREIFLFLAEVAGMQGSQMVLVSNAALFPLRISFHCVKYVLFLAEVAGLQGSQSC